MNNKCKHCGKEYNFILPDGYCYGCRDYIKAENSPQVEQGKVIHTNDEDCKLGLHNMCYETNPQTEKWEERCVLCKKELGSVYITDHLEKFCSYDCAEKKYPYHRQPTDKWASDFRGKLKQWDLDSNFSTEDLVDYVRTLLQAQREADRKELEEIHENVMKMALDSYNEATTLNLTNSKPTPDINLEKMGYIFRHKLKDLQAKLKSLKL